MSLRTTFRFPDGVIDAPDFEGDVCVCTVLLEPAECLMRRKTNLELPGTGCSGGTQQLAVLLDDALEEHIAAGVPVKRIQALAVVIRHFDDALGFDL